ncbi:MAG TPA: S-methyl-5-thioribose-1-phosphate isomerase [Gammaproteobacteria bacterium]|nr:S-methyl-5-thioribose-1-phosphate isomerase [Gammaproteobacteria bacterium]
MMDAQQEVKAGAVDVVLYDSIRPVEWRDGAVRLIDQRLLPSRTDHVICRSAAEVADAIRNMTVRGAPAIGVAAAYGVVLAARDRYAEDPATWRQAVDSDLDRLASARPTAVNLGWAVNRMRRTLEGLEGEPVAPLLEEANAILREDLEANRRMGELGAALIDSASGVLTHCNAGALATAGYGTALGVIRSAFQLGKLKHVYADETRPWLQGSRLTAWELIHDRIPVSLIADGAANYAMAQGRVQWVIVGADRVAANGDVANKIGTYGLAVSARHHGVGFMVVAPTSTIDRGCPDGGSIPIENRAGEELLSLGDARVAASGAEAWNPVFDVTPAALVDVLVTERGVIRQPDAAKIAALFE